MKKVLLATTAVAAFVAFSGVAQAQDPVALMLARRKGAVVQALPLPLQSAAQSSST